MNIFLGISLPSTPSIHEWQNQGLVWYHCRKVTPLIFQELITWYHGLTINTILAQVHSTGLRWFKMQLGFLHFWLPCLQWFKWFLSNNLLVHHYSLICIINSACILYFIEMNHSSVGRFLGLFWNPNTSYVSLIGQLRFSVDYWSWWEIIHPSVDILQHE